MNNQQNYLTDNRNIAKLGTGVLLTAASLYGLYYLLPVLNTIVWEGINLIAGIGVLGALLYIGPTFIKKLPIVNAKIAKLLTGWIIAWDEFIIQEMAINQAEEDREEIKEQISILEGEKAKKEDELEEAHVKLDESKSLVQELRSTRSDDDPELGLYVNEMVRQQDFIQSIEPLKNNIAELSEMCKKVYQATGIKIKDARAELKLQKSKLASLTAGQNAMNRALSIFTEKSPELIMAEERVKDIIGKKIGSIRNSVDIIKPLMQEKALKDKVKVKAALNQLNQITSGENVVSTPNIMVPSNKFEFLNKNK